MHTLLNPRHEAFAVALAQGFPPNMAYNTAGFSPKNRKARAHALTKNKKIKARVEVLQACLPHINDLKDRFAPTLRLQPETKEAMTAWLWQVMSGTRKLLPIQMRAATLFIRLNGWHLRDLTTSTSKDATPTAAPIPTPDTTSHPPQHPEISPPTRLTNHYLIEAERTLLACHNLETLQADLQHRSIGPQAATAYVSTMADLALIAATQRPTRRIPKEKDFAPPSNSTPDTPTPSPSPQIAAQKSPSQLPHPQLPTPPSSPNGDKKTTRQSSVALAKDEPNGDKNTTPATTSAIPTAPDLTTRLLLLVDLPAAPEPLAATPPNHRSSRALMTRQRHTA